MYRILREGTEAAYSNLDFSPSGEKLASVGSHPDYMMTIWDWKKVKTFGSDIFLNLNFNVSQLMVIVQFIY